MTTSNTATPVEVQEGIESKTPDTTWRPKDKLDREKSAQLLTNYLINKYETEKGLSGNESFVLNINAHWGFGKTYFLTNWKRDLETQKYPVVFFNAWDSDYYEDPMIAFICEIKIQLKDYFKGDDETNDVFKNTINKGFKLLKVGLPVITSILTKKLTGYTYEQIADLYQKSDGSDNTGDSKTKHEIETAVAKIFVKSAEDAIASYEQSKKDIKDFKGELSDLIQKSQSNGKTKAPLFIFIDELDRCRPTYAIELLEKIKHIFSAPGVYFIVATASNQLCHSIKSIYGSGFDAETYLKRFFDQIYEFQDPDLYQFAGYLFEKFHIIKHKSKLFSPLERYLIDARDKDIELFVLFSKYFKLGLRDQEQVVDAFYTICLTWENKGSIHLGLMFYLLMLKQRSDEMFSKLIKFHANIFQKSIVPDYPQLVDASIKIKLSKNSLEVDENIEPPAHSELKLEKLVGHYLQHMNEGYKSLAVRFHGKNGENKIFQEIDHKKIKEVEGLDIPIADSHLDFTKYFDCVKQIGQLKQSL